MQFADLQAVSDQGSLYAFLSQRVLSDHVEERLGEYRYEIDMLEERLSFISAASGARIDTHVDLVASIAPGPRSVLWGWAHPQATGELASELKAYGEAHSIPSLSAAEIPLPTSATGEDLTKEIDDAAHIIGWVAVAVTGRAPYYSAPAGGGTRVVFLLSGYDFPALRLDVRVPTSVMQALSLGTIHDHRAAMHWLAIRAGWQLSWNADWSEAQLRDPENGNGLTATFDSQARLANMQVHYHPEPSGP